MADAIGTVAGVAVDLGALRWPGSGTTERTGDTIAPTAPSNLLATTGGTNEVSLSWTASMDDVGVTGYDVYRNGTPVGTTTSSRYTDSGLAAASTYAYFVTAKDAAGLVSGPSNTAKVTTTPPPSDTVAPTVTNISPRDGTAIGKSVNVSATASDNVTVIRMEVYVDGALRATSGASSVSFGWNTKSLARGAHTITVKAYDGAGNAGSRSVTVYK